MMKTKLLFLPLMAMLVATSCSSNQVGELSEGKLPEGGSTLLIKEEKDQRLTKIIKGVSDYLKDVDKFGIDYNLESVAIKAVAPKLDAELSMDGGCVFGGSNLLEGNKETVKLGFSTKNINLKSKFNLAIDGDTAFNHMKEKEIKPMSGYLDSGNLYLDLSQVDVESFIGTACKFAHPFLETFVGEDSSATLIVESLKDNPEGLTTILKLFLGQDFNYKLAIEGVSEKLPSLPIVIINEDSMMNYGKKASNFVEEKTGLKLDDVTSVVDYGGQTGIQISIPFEQVKLNIPTDAFSVTIAPESAFNLAFIFDDKDRPTSINLSAQIGAVISGEKITTALGGDLTVGLMAKESVRFDYGKCLIEFPENYDAFASLSALPLSMLG